MESPRDHIGAKLKKIVTDLKFEKPPTIKEIDDSRFGDYFSNVAMQAFKLVKANIEGTYLHTDYGLARDPLDMAEKIKNAFGEDEIVSKIEVAKPGFINFYLSQKSLVENLNLILQQKENFGQSAILRNMKVMVEFTDPNPLKEFHIGHLYSNAVGESIARLTESQGAEVWRANYQGDVGMHVAKALWGIMHHELKMEEAEGKPLLERAKFLGEAYALGAKAYEEDEAAKQEIVSLNKKVYEKDPEVYPLYEKARQWSLDYFETIYQRLGTTFKRYYFESEAGPVGMEIVKEHIGDVFQEEGGAVIFPKEKSGLHTRVFINSLGLPTYEAKELGLAPTKYKDFPYDLSIIITGNEINEYFKVLLKALSLIRPELAEKTKHLSHGMVRLPSGKMSSRTGDVITGEWLLQETKQKLEEAYPDMAQDVAEKLAVGAVKYALLKGTIGQDITFSFEESINLHGNSGPYVQYTHARTQSVLEKAGGTWQVASGQENYTPHATSYQQEELDLLRMLVHFPEIVEESAEKFSPNHVCTYLFELSQAFNLFYEKHRVLNAENDEAKNFRIALTAGVGHVLKNGLHLLGIQAPQKI
ncbi:MAG: arginine--tRNA ligase [Candidatus Levyibacteriota bacterium]